jgi:hypothetical protein
VKREQDAHERLIPLLVDIVGAHRYLEIGTHMNQTIGRVVCPVRIGVDPAAVETPGMIMFKMTSEEFLQEHAAKHAPYDVVFIDGDHSAAMVRADFIGLWPYVSADGMVILHDMQPEHESDAQPGFCGDSWKVGVHIVGGYEACTLNYHPGLMLVRKRSRWGPLP